MPIPVDGSLPTIITKPNQRYAATFLSTKYRKYADACSGAYNF